MNKIKLAVLAFAILIGVVALTPGYSYASTTDEIRKGVEVIGGKEEPTEKFTVRLAGIVNVMMFILGAIAVIMIIVGGIRYTTSGGDSTKVTAAKNTLLYAVVGLVVAILAYAIVNFVVDAL